MKGITVEQIKKETQEDKTLQKLLNHVRSGKKPVTPELHQYRNIFPELYICNRSANPTTPHCFTTIITSESHLQST